MKSPKKYKGWNPPEQKPTRVAVYRTAVENSAGTKLLEEAFQFFDADGKWHWCAETMAGARAQEAISSLQGVYWKEVTKKP